jgi:hypothetical protein
VIEIRPEYREAADAAARARGFPEIRDMLAFYERRDIETNSDEEDRRRVLALRRIAK